MQLVVQYLTKAAIKLPSAGDQWRSQKFSTRGTSICRIPFFVTIPINGDAHIVCRIRLESIEARLSLIDKNIGTSARFYA